MTIRIRPCADADIDAIGRVVNAAAVAYAGVIPADCYHVPYMPPRELHGEIESGVCFWGWYDDRAAERQPDGPADDTSTSPPGDERLLGVMGIQDVADVTLIRHAYVLPGEQGSGIGRQLLAQLVDLATRPLLVGTWEDAVGAVRFYEQNGFTLVSTAEKSRLLRRYWSISSRQVETSVVLHRPLLKTHGVDSGAGSG
ncbi:MAG TPA: GNAT family N-acetyltransferase [Thermoleophilia bacterium]|nr:GNAT family N-acetyltransferase [Thermoleophilia bacterium]